MKPHSSSPLLLSARGTPGIDMGMLGAAKAQTLPDVASDPAFALIMAQQLATVSTDASDALDGHFRSVVAEIPVAEEAQTGQEAALPNFSDAMVLPMMQTPVEPVTMAEVPLTATGSASAPTMASSVAAQMPPAAPPLDGRASAGTPHKASTDALQTPGRATQALFQSAPLKRGSVETLADPREGAKTPVTVSANQGNGALTAEVDRVMQLAFVNPQPASSTAVAVHARFESRGGDGPPLPRASSVAPASALAVQVTTPAPPQLGLSMAHLVARSNEEAPSTLEAFGQRQRPVASTENRMVRPTVVTDGAVQMAAAWPAAQPLPVAPPMTPITSNGQPVAQAWSEGATALQMPADRPQDPVPSWMPQVPTAMAPQVVAPRHEMVALHQTVGTAAFADELVGQVSLWVRKSEQTGPMTAELHLNPADMGPVQVRIEMNGSSAQVNFVAQHWETRQIIEASFASLSNALQEAGIQLSGSGVSDQAPQQQASSGFGARGEDAPRPWQSPPSPQRPAPDKPELTDLEMSNAASWSAPRAGQSASGLDLYA